MVDASRFGIETLGPPCIPIGNCASEIDFVKCGISKIGAAKVGALKVGMREIRQ